MSHREIVPGRGVGHRGHRGTHSPRRRRRSLGTAGLALAAGAALAALAACGKGDGDARAASATPPAPPPIVVGPEVIAVVTRDTIQVGPAISGSLAPEREATLRAEVGGTVTAALGEAGQRVSRGQVLARIETAGLSDQVTSARSQVAAAEANYQTAQRDAERNERLLQAGAIAARDAENARSQASAARAQLEAARAQLANAQKLLGNTTVVAPFGGIVGTKTVSTGDVVQPGTALFTVVDPSSMRLEASVPAEQLSQVRLGAAVRFTVNGYPGREFLGRISRVAPVADPTTRQVQIIASIPNAGNRLVAGLFAEGRVASETRDAIVAPATAVDQRGVTPTVVRVKNGRAEKVQVELGLADEGTERVEIRRGVQVGDTLLLGQAQGISPNTPVRVSTVRDAGAATKN
jgi:RND family efflux transporter MFP subunit